MKPGRWRQIDRVFAAALERPPPERAGFLEEACGDDGEMRREVEELLAAEGAARSFLEDPPSRSAVARAVGASEPTGEVRRIGPYELLLPIGRGGMSTVYLALRDEDRYRRRVAVKLIRRGFESPEVVHRFRIERQILARLEHPSIARLYEGGTTEDGRPFLVMEYIEGLPLDEYCDRRRLPVEQRLELFLDVCRAVHFAHQNLLVHRDLKPANILVTADGQVKLLDFGIAKLLAERPDAAQHTRTGLRPMTPGYASPEQVRGESITTGTDVYALGVLLYRLLCGRGPYVLRRDLPHELERAILEQEPAKPSDAVERREDREAGDAASRTQELARRRRATPRELRRRLRGDLDTIVLKALRKRPERRYPSVRELAGDVERHLTDRPVAARPDSLGYRLGKFARRNTAAVVAGGVVAFGLVAFSSVTLLQSSRIARERDIARLERARVQQVSDFLMELFEGSDPNATKGGELSVRDVLDRGAEKIERLGDQPELQAAYMSTMGQAYRSLGLYDVATPLLDRALRLDRRLNGEESSEAARSLNELAMSLQEEGDFDHAEALFREALAIRRRLLGNGHQDVAESLNNLALLLHFKGEHEAAEPLYRESLTAARELFGDEHANVADVLANLALVLHETGEYEEAEPLYRESLAMTRKLYGAETYEVATSLNNLASLLLDTGDLENAEALFRESLALRRRLFGERHPAVSIALNNLASLMYQKRDHETAEPLYRQSLAMGRELFGEDHPRVANTLTGLARLLLATGRPADGERLARDALAIYRAKLPPDHFRASYARTVLGGCLTALDRHDEAESLLVESYPALESQLGGREPMTRDALSLIVAHYDGRGMPQAAAEYRALRTGSR